jgi:hypothetical protein
MTTTHPMTMQGPRPSARAAASEVRTAGRRGTAIAGLVYLALAILVWWNVWFTHPTTTTTCGCGDAARFVWFFAWPSFALTHGHSLFYSQWLFHPTGINLLNDTSVLALGVLFTPVTLAFGPVAAMNVALTLAPALSALAMYALLRRWVRWAPAAFVGGLVYGFSPFLITELALNQVNIAFLAIPPLVVLALDDLFVRQRRSPCRVGAVLALLIAVQFFVSTEVLVITVLFGLIAVVFMIGGVALRQRGEIGPRASHALRGTCVALGGGAVVLGYPLWFLLRGQAHLTGPIWSNGSLSQYGNTVSSFVTSGGLGSLSATMSRFGGYQGPALPGLGYLGVGVVVVAVGGTVVWRHDRRLLLFGGVGLVAAALSLGPGHGYWVPWTLVEKVPLVGDIVEVRFMVVLVLCAAVMVAVVIDHGRTWLMTQRSTISRLAANALAATGAALMIVPTVVVLWPNVPLTTTAVVLPRWFSSVGPRLPTATVVLSYPVPFSGLQSSQAWQAVDTMRWKQAGGGGPEGVLSRAGTAKAGFEVLLDASLPLGAPPGPSPSNLAAIRAALEMWKVTTVVVPDQSVLPLYERGRSNAYAVGLFTAALGRRPVYGAGAWVWSVASDTAAAPVSLSDAAFATCVTGPPSTTPSPEAVPTCVLGAGG